MDEVVRVLAGWQRDGGPGQLHSGDLGWQWRLGIQEVASSTRVWRRDGQILALGMVDGGTVTRMGIAPRIDDDEGFAKQVVADLSDRTRGLPAAGSGVVEVRFGAALRALLSRSGWIPPSRGHR